MLTIVRNPIPLFGLLSALVASWLVSPACGAEEPRLITAIRRDMSAAMQREAGATTDRERAAAIYDLTLIYGELKVDPRLPLSDTLQGYKAELWSRLRRVQTKLERRFAREAKGRSSRRESDAWGSPQSHQASQALASHLELVGASLGGPLRLLGETRQSAAGSSPGATNNSPIPARGGRPGPPDFGPALVDLIQRTIAPDSWDIHGGPGTIVYYPAFHCLVVRARGEVHEAIGGLLGGLGR